MQYTWETKLETNLLFGDQERILIKSENLGKT